MDMQCVGRAATLHTVCSSTSTTSEKLEEQPKNTDESKEDGQGQEDTDYAFCDGAQSDNSPKLCIRDDPNSAQEALVSHAEHADPR